MLPGHDLDRLIAEKVFKLKGYAVDNCLPYSSNLSSAWQVVEKFDLIALTKGTDGIWRFQIGIRRTPSKSEGMPDKIIQVDATSSSAAHAICLAALKACE